MNLPPSYRVEHTESGARLFSEKQVKRHDPKGSREMGSRSVARFRGTSVAVIRRVAELDSMGRHREVSELLRQYGAGVIRWGSVDTNGLPKRAGNRHANTVALPYLKRVRVLKGFPTVRALSEASGVGESHIRRIESGEAKAGEDVVRDLACALGVGKEDLT